MNYKIVIGYSVLVASGSLYTQSSEHEKSLIAEISYYASVPTALQKELEALPPSSQSYALVSEGAHTNILFKYYPRLSSTLSYVNLCDLPSPIHYCTQLKTMFSGVNIFVKEDGKIGKKNDGVRAVGSNKVRKLEYILADARAWGHAAILTFGCVGSNHAAQTALYARGMGFEAFCMLKPQPHSSVVQDNLLVHAAVASQLFYAPNNQARAAQAVSLCIDYKRANQQLPYSIGTGGSNPLGTVGYVQAMFELKEQIDAGLLPEPDHIYVVSGSGGTAAGLLLGAAACGITSMFHFVLIEPGIEDEMREAIEALFTSTNQLLHAHDATFAVYEFTNHNFIFNTTYAHADYGVFIKEGDAAMRVMREQEGITVDGVYTAKCCAALFSDLNSKKISEGTVLFWNTVSDGASCVVPWAVDYRVLPESLHEYFKNS